MFVLPPSGVFEIYCQTSNHYQAGMREHYSVSKCGKRDLAPAPPYRGVRTYYIAAEELEWDYAPDRSWERERHSHSTERYISFGDALGKDFRQTLVKSVRATWPRVTWCTCYCWVLMELLPSTFAATAGLWENYQLAKLLPQVSCLFPMSI